MCGIDRGAMEYLFLCNLKVFGDGSHIGGITNRLRGKGICDMNINCGFCKG
jgi:hypothetical protein